uniref:Uncharacterized protein n=1 Tax=Cyanophora biloba TaxID=1489483 RepID=A0A2Z4HGT1_9EUKA|nr:hypothetical protein [Cyanophora biloba]AWW13833.1 hypothetical protein [Cyanophora biloba]
MLEFSLLTKITFGFTILFLILSIIGIIKGWKPRFQFIGITSFLCLLTISFFVFTFVPFTHKIVPGSQKYRVVFDDGAAQVVIAVSSKLNKNELTATLEQASSDLFSSGRLSRDNNSFIIKARALSDSQITSNNSIYLGELDKTLNLTTNNFDTIIKIYK